MTLFLHRAVLKIFGLWKEEREAEFHEGTFELDRCDPKTKILIKKAVVQGIKPSPTLTSNDKVKFESTGSNDILIDESQAPKILHRHDYNEEKNEIEAVTKHPQYFMNAREETFIDPKGRLALKLRQENVKLRLRPLVTFDRNKKYPVQRIAVVSSEIEEPIDYYPGVLILAIKLYMSLTSSYLKGLFTKYRAPRKPVDMYTYMFLLEFINFFVLVFGFSTFAVSLKFWVFNF